MVGEWGEVKKFAGSPFVCPEAVSSSSTRPRSNTSEEPFWRPLPPCTRVRMRVLDVLQPDGSESALSSSSRTRDAGRRSLLRDGMFWPRQSELQIELKRWYWILKMPTVNPQNAAVLPSNMIDPRSSSYKFEDKSSSTVRTKCFNYNHVVSYLVDINGRIVRLSLIFSRSQVSTVSLRLPFV